MLADIISDCLLLQFSSLLRALTHHKRSHPTFVASVETQMEQAVGFLVTLPTRTRDKSPFSKVAFLHHLVHVQHV